MLNYQKVFLRDGKLGSALRQICICHGTSSPAASLADFARTPWLCLRSKIESLPRPKKSRAKAPQQWRWRSLEIAGDRDRFQVMIEKHATGLTMPRVIHQKLLTRWPWFVFWKTFLIRLNNVQKTHRQSGDFTNRNGMDTRKNSGEFPGKKQLQTFFFCEGIHGETFPARSIYITERFTMGKFHHVKMGWEPMVNWSPWSLSSHPRTESMVIGFISILSWTWSDDAPAGGSKVVHLVVRHIWRHITRFSIVFVLTNISVIYIEDSSLRYSWLVRLGKIV